MATLISEDGTQRAVTPHPGEQFSLRELYKLLGCTTIETKPLANRRTMVLDEDGKAKERAFNPMATRLLIARGQIARDDYVVGPVLIAEDGELK